MPTATLEEYLEAIYRLGEHGPVRPSQIADAMGVSGPTVTMTLKRLEQQGLVSRDGTAVILTGQGQSVALDVIRRHRLAERFLVDTLGLDWDSAHDDACLLEHALSPRVLDALEAFLDNPVSCPHGQPIPTKNGAIAEAAGSPLSEVETGSRCRIVSVSDESDEVLSYLGSIGAYPGTELEVLEAAPFDGPLLVRIGQRAVALAREIAHRIAVEPAS